MNGRRRPYTEIGVSRLPCVRCGAKSSFQWQICSDVPMSGTFEKEKRKIKVAIERGTAVVMLDGVACPAEDFQVPWGVVAAIAVLVVNGQAVRVHVIPASLAGQFSDPVDAGGEAPGAIIDPVGSTGDPARQQLSAALTADDPSTPIAREATDDRAAADLAIPAGATAVGTVQSVGLPERLVGELVPAGLASACDDTEFDRTGAGAVGRRDPAAGRTAGAERSTLDQRATVAGVRAEAFRANSPDRVAACLTERRGENLHVHFTTMPDGFTVPSGPIPIISYPDKRGGNLFRPLCAGCDLELNRMVLEWAGFPDWREKMARYEAAMRG